MNEKLDRAAKVYMDQVGCSLDTARQRVREAIGRPSEGYGSGKGRGRAQGADKAAQVGGIRSDRAEDAAVILERADLGGFIREFRFHPVRRWRLDFYWPDVRVALEIEGRLPPWMDGKNVSHHTSWSGYESDCEKYSEAAVLGIRVIRCTTSMMSDGRMVGLMRRALETSERKTSEKKERVEA